MSLNDPKRTLGQQRLALYRIFASSSSNSALADLRSGVSKPSVNQPYMSESSRRASWCRPCRLQRRAKLVVALSSKALLSWCCAVLIA